MNTKKYLASTLLAGSLIFGVPMHNPAHGQDKAMEPQSSWSISKVDRSTQGGNSYCTLSRQYDDGVVLSLGRNTAEEYSLAIDFQKQKFEKDKALKINLQPGPGKLRAYDMLPASEKAVVVRLGWDEGFFDTLNQSQAMRVKIGEESYSFAIPQIAKGQADLEDCMEELKTASKPQSAPSTAAATKDVLDAEPVKTSKDFSAGRVNGEEIAALKSDVDTQEKKVLQDFARSMSDQERTESGAKTKSNINKSEGKQIASAEPKKAARPDSDAIINPDRKLTNPGKSLAELAPAAGNAADDMNIKFVPDVAPAAKPSPAKVASNITPLMSGEAEPENGLELATAERAAKSAPVNDKAAAEHAKKLKEAEARLASMETENAALLEKMKKADDRPADTADTNVMKAQLEQANARIKTLQEEVQSARSESAAKPDAADVHEVKTKADELAIKNKQLEESLRQAQTRIAETAINTETRSLKTIADLQLKLDAAQKDSVNIAKKLEETNQKTENNKLAMVSGNWDLEQATKRFTEADRELRRMAQQLEKEKMSCNREKSEIEQMLFDPAVAEQKQIEKLVMMQDQLETAQAQLADPKRIVELEVEQRVKDRVAAIDADKLALQTEIGNLKANAALHTNVEDNEKALQQRIASLEAVVAQKDNFASTQKAALENQIAALEKSVQEKTAASDKQSDLSEKVASLNAALTAKDAALSEKEKALADKVKAVSDKEQQIAALKAEPKIDPAVAEHRIAEEVIKTKAAAELEMTALRDQNKSISANLETLQKSLAEKGAVSGEMAAQLASLNSSLTQKSQELAGKDKEIAALKALPRIEPATVDRRIGEEVAKVRAASDVQIAALKSQNDTALASLKTQSQMELASLKTQTQVTATEMEALKRAAAEKDKALAAALAVPKEDPAVQKKLDTAMGDIALFREEADTLRKQNQSLRAETDKIHLQLADASSNGAARADKLAALQLEIEDMRRQTAMKDTQTVTYQNQLALLQKENTQIKTRLTETDTVKSTSASQMDTLNRQVQAMQKQMSDMESRYKAELKQAQSDNDRSASVSPAAFAAANIAPAAGIAAAGTVASTYIQPRSPSSATGTGAPSAYDANGVQSLLQKSGVGASGVQKAAYGMTGAQNFGWSTNNIKGLASIKPMGSSVEFDGLVKQYLASQKSQCGGDFASMLSPSGSGASRRMALYETACVSAAQSTSASLIFFEDRGQFVAMSSQASAADMDSAMDSRDKIAGAVRGL